MKKGTKKLFTLLSICILYSIPFFITDYQTENQQKGMILEVYAENTEMFTGEIFSVKAEPEDISKTKTISSGEVVLEEKIADISQKYTEVNKFFYVNKDTVIKSQDNEESESIGEIKYGEYINVIGENLYENDGFYKVLINDTEGFISIKDVTLNILFKKENTFVYAKDDFNAFDNYEIIGENIQEIKKYKEIKVIGENKQLDLYQILIDEKEYYINKQDVSTEMLFTDENSRMYVKDKCNIYSSYNTSSDILDKLSAFEEIEILGFSEKWAKVKISKNTYGYIEKELLTKNCPTALKAVNYAYRMIGTPYVYGAASTKSTDCSGFTLQCYRYAGITIPRTSRAQNNCGTKVSYSEAKPGDLITWSGGNNGYVTHVGMYVGNGIMIHASCSKGVTTASVSDYMKHSQLVSVVRVVED